MHNHLKKCRALRKIHEKGTFDLRKRAETIKYGGSFDKNIIEKSIFFCYIEKNDQKLQGAKEQTNEEEFA